MQYQVFADYGYISEEHFGQFATYQEAQAFVESNADDILTDHEVLEVAYFTEDGEYVSMDVLRAEDYDDGQPTEYEEWQDYMGGDDRFETCNYMEDY